MLGNLWQDPNSAVSVFISVYIIHFYNLKASSFRAGMKIYRPSRGWSSGLGPLGAGGCDDAAERWKPCPVRLNQGKRAWTSPMKPKPCY